MIKRYHNGVSFLFVALCTTLNGCKTESKFSEDRISSSTTGQSLEEGFCEGLCQLEAAWINRVAAMESDSLPALSPMSKDLHLDEDVLLAMRDRGLHAHEFRDQFRRFIAGAAAEVQHVVDVPGRPLGVVVSNFSLRIGDLPATVQAFGYKERLSGAIVFSKKRPTGFSDYTIGNGVLVSPNAILTAKHVARAVHRDTDGTRIIGFHQDDPWRPELRKFVSVSYLGEGPDPDLAVVWVKPVDREWHPGKALSSSVPQVEDNVYLVGAYEFSESPRLATSFTTTVFSTRLLERDYQRSVLGTALSTFAGQSGSPVYRSDNGQLVGLYVAGHKAWALGGEYVVKAPEKSKWEDFKGWSWVAPVAPYMQELQKILTNSP